MHCKRFARRPLACQAALLLLTRGSMQHTGASFSSAGAAYHKMLSYLPHTPRQAQARCAAATGVPKVALLLLTRGPMPHEGAWRLWFAAAAGEVPLAALRAGGCSAKAYADVAAACSANALAADAIGNQHMFSVYVHTPLGFDGALPGRRLDLVHASLPSHVSSVMLVCCSSSVYLSRLLVLSLLCTFWCSVTENRRGSTRIVLYNCGL